MPLEEGNVICFDRKKYLTYTSILGQGGTGMAFLFRDETLNMSFAVKKYFPSPENDIKDCYDRFVHEIKILHHLTHPNIVRIFTAYMYPEHQTGFIQMEYINGKPIDQFTPANSKTWEILFLEAIDAFKYINQNRIMHRDIRPANLLVDTEGRLKVIDFGFGKKLDVDESAGRSMLVNIPAEHPLEVTRDKKYTVQTEIYYLGYLFAHLSAIKNLPQFKFKNILDKMVQIDPALRYRDFQEIVNDTSNSTLISVNFDENEIFDYRRMAASLTESISLFFDKYVLQRNTNEILVSLEATLQACALEEVLHNNGTLIKCFIKTGFSFSRFPRIDVEIVRDFYLFFSALPESKRQIVLDNLDGRFSQIKIEDTSDPFSGMPF